MDNQETPQPQPTPQPHHHHHHHHRRPKRRFHPWRWLGGVVAVVLIAIGAYGWYVYHSIKTTTQNTYIPLSKKKADAAKQALSSQKPLSILLMGTDTGAFGRTEVRGRSDTMILVTVNPTTKVTTMTSIPRDTMAQMIGSTGVNIQKVNAAYSLGGADMAVDTVSALLNVPIQQYAVVNMGGLEKVVDAVGGVNVTVPFDFKNTGYTFTKGDMHLTGAAALAYVRMRYEDPKGDYGRAERQRQVITAILKAAPSLNTLANFKTLLTQVQDNLRTSMSLDDMIAIYQHYKPAAATVKQDVLQGVGAYLNGSSYQIASTKELQRVSDKLRGEMGLSKATLENEETKQNANNPQFDWTATNATGYTVTGADKVN
ncbi:LCP family protein [Lacticaseibacillus kribbianus]|uniref:LCP family glycopolymer transferase n=1 Tax=Lacticaseibacillus kribbianus TaxID=2926292 RepID=UPI001CD6AF39|nr:LCP family protein [Lacticaseibacillus kribbianus]